MEILILIPSITSYYTFLTEVTNKLIIDNNEVNIAASPEHLKNVNCPLLFNYLCSGVSWL